MLSPRHEQPADIGDGPSFCPEGNHILSRFDLCARQLCELRATSFSEKNVNFSRAFRDVSTLLPPPPTPSPTPPPPHLPPSFHALFPPPGEVHKITQDEVFLFFWGRQSNVDKEAVYVKSDQPLHSGDLCRDIIAEWSFGFVAFRD